MFQPLYLHATEQVGPRDRILLATQCLLSCGALTSDHSLTQLCTYPDLILYILLFCLRRTTLCSLKMPLSAQFFAWLLGCVSAAASRGQVPRRERVKSILAPLRYQSVLLGAVAETNNYPDPENFKSIAECRGAL